MKHYIGIDIGGTNTVMGVLTAEGRVRQRVVIPTQTHLSLEALVADISGNCRRMAGNLGILPAELRWVGVGCPGVIQDRTVVYAGNLNFHNVPLAELLERRLGTKILLENDGNAAAWGEYIMGDIGQNETLAVITLGTGIGSGIVCKGSILSGSKGGAPELGHVMISHGGRLCQCGNRGCLEAYCSATALLEAAREAAAAHPQSPLAKAPAKTLAPPLIFDLAHQGDPVAAELVDSFISHLAGGIISLINVVQPDIIRIGGGISLQGESLLAPLRAEVDRLLLSHTQGPRIELCRLGDNAGFIGAAMLGRQAE